MVSETTCYFRLAGKWAIDFGMALRTRHANEEQRNSWTAFRGPPVAGRDLDGVGFRVGSGRSKAVSDQH